MEAVDVMALQIRPASSGEIVFSTAATMSLDLLVYLCLVDSLQLLKSNHFLWSGGIFQATKNSFRRLRYISAAVAWDGTISSLWVDVVLLVSGLKKVSSTISNLLNAPRTALETSLSADVDSSVSYTFKINKKLENPLNFHYSLNRFAAFFDFVRVRG